MALKSPSAGGIVRHCRRKTSFRAGGNNLHFMTSRRQVVESKPAVRRLTCNFAIDTPPPTSAFHLPRQLEEEAVVEGLLHVTVLQAGSCWERYGDLEDMSRTAPAPMSLASALTKSSSTGTNNQLVNEAVCLASPPDNPTEEQRRVATIMRQGLRAADEEVRRAASHEVEELVNLEAVACHRTALFNLYTQEVLQASAQVSRQRRRALLRALRASRDTTKSLLQGPTALLASLASWDGSDATEKDQT